MEWLGEKLFGGIVRKFSVSTHHYLYDFEGPHKETRSHASMVEFTLVPDEDDLVKLVPKPEFRNPDVEGECVFLRELSAKMKEGQRAIIMRLSIRFVSNGTAAEQLFHIKDMFTPELGRVPPRPPPPPPLLPVVEGEESEIVVLEDVALVSDTSVPEPNAEGEEDEYEDDDFGEYMPHPDKTGETEFGVPPFMRKNVPKDDQTVYEPNLVNLEGMNVLMYAGMEKLIMHPRSSILPQTAEDILGGDGPGAMCRAYEVFKAGDPAAVFVIQHRDDPGLETTPADVIEQKGEQGEVIYIISKRILGRVRSLFKTTIFPLLKYTRFENITMRWVQPDRETCVALYEKHKEALESGKPEDAPTIVMLFVVDYMVVTPNQPMYKAKTIDLGL